ncbi:MAG: GTP-binding protein, partial [Myxococcota bacterium]
MKVFEPQHIRNVALVGHKACGKTSIAEAALWAAKATPRLGNTQAGTSTLDYEPEEHKRVMTVSTSVASFEWKKTKFNVLDTPGDANFLRDTRVSLPAADAAVCVVSAKDGVEPMTERVFGWAVEEGLDRCFFVSKMDTESADFSRTLEDIKEHACREAVPVQLPIGQGAGFEGVIDLLEERALIFGSGDDGLYDWVEIPAQLRDEASHARNQLIEDIAANDEELMEKFFEEALTNEEIVSGLVAAMRSGSIVPVFCGSGTSNRGVTSWLDAWTRIGPSPADRPAFVGTRDGEPAEVSADPEAQPQCQVFKTIVDQHAGKISVLRVLSGTVKADLTLENVGRESGKERIGHPQVLIGKKMDAIEIVKAGDIFAVAKLKDVHTGDTLSSDGFRLAAVELAPPLISRAIHAADPSQEDKILSGLQRIVEEDPGLVISRDPQSGEVLLSGTGQQHIEVAVEKMQRKFGVSCQLALPRIPYQETFTKPVKNVEGKHKKQSGGHGQFAVVMMDFAPAERGTDLTFDDAVVGG